ncbi:MAG: GNAT family N-acetyltransferase [Halobacteriota archaeon]
MNVSRPRGGRPLHVTGYDEGDCPAIRELLTRSLREADQRPADTVDGLLDSLFSEYPLHERLSRPGTVCYVARVGGDVVGFTAGSLALDELGEVRWLHVDPAHRRTGVGTALLTVVRAELFRWGACAIRVAVLAASRSDQEFLERRGFRRSPRHELVGRRRGRAQTEASIIEFVYLDDDFDGPRNVPSGEDNVVDREQSATTSERRATESY